MHPREFWEAEHQRSPNYDASWEWCRGTYHCGAGRGSNALRSCRSVTRLTPQQRAWARERFGVALPRVIRSDEPSSRRIGMGDLANHHRGT